MPKHVHAGHEDEGAVRLRELTVYVYRAIIGGTP